MYIVLLHCFVIILRKCCRGGFFRQQLGHLPTLQRCDLYVNISAIREGQIIQCNFSLEKFFISVII
jgi:hypothetical protein